MHAAWREFLEQQGMRVTDANGGARAFGGPAAESQTARCVDMNHYAAMRLAGTDATKFLQGYLTCDVAAVDATHALHGAYCNIKGRVVADATVLLTEAQPTLVVHASLRALVGDSLRRYLAFSRSRFDPPDAAPILLGLIEPRDAALPLEPLTVASYRGGHAIAIPGTTPRVLLVLPFAQASDLWREYASRGLTGDAAPWDLIDVRSGVAHVCAATSESFLPQMLDYDRTGSVSFTKGCYLGQEIVARTQHLGRPKRHLHTLRWRGLPPSVGASLFDAAQRNAGTLVASAAVAADHGEALAVLNDAVQGPLRADGTEFEAA